MTAVKVVHYSFLLILPGLFETFVVLPGLCFTFICDILRKRLTIADIFPKNIREGLEKHTRSDQLTLMIFISLG
jgi:hypothetical protein